MYICVAAWGIEAFRDVVAHHGGPVTLWEQFYVNVRLLRYVHAGLAPWRLRERATPRVVCILDLPRDHRTVELDLAVVLHGQPDVRIYSTNLLPCLDGALPLHPRHNVSIFILAIMRVHRAELQARRKH